MTISENQLVSELWAQDVRFILGTAPNHPPTLSPADLITALAESKEARLQLSLIPVFLRHPKFSEQVKFAAEKLNPNLQLLLKCFYSAAVWLEQKHLSTNHLPDLFSEELGILPSEDPEENLKALAMQQKELSGLRINWLGTYQHAAEIWLKELELQKA
jgi:hypothetical protein